jgi:hypothetical protein
MAAVGNLILLQDGTKWHAAFQNKTLSLLRQEIKMNADGSKLDGFAIAPPMQYRGADEVVADAGAGGDFEVDLTGVKVAQMRGHVAIMHEQMAFMFCQSFWFDKGDAWSRVANAVKENQRREDVLILSRGVIHRWGHAAV